MKIRAWADADLAAVYAIQMKCPQAAQWAQEDYLQLARDPGAKILVAHLEATKAPEIAGFAVFHRVLSEAELRNIAIDPAHQRKGISRALLAAGMRAMQEAGARQLFLEVRASNQAARAFYASAGFRLQYRRHDYYQNPLEDGLVMARDLTPFPHSPQDMLE